MWGLLEVSWAHQSSINHKSVFWQLGAIRKVPAVIETAEGDFIGIRRHRLFLSHSYDHRVVNGALGGQFVQAVKLIILEAWDEQ